MEKLCCWCDVTDDDDDERLAFNGDLYFCMEGLSLFLILSVDFVPGPARASTTWNRQRMSLYFFLFCVYCLALYQTMKIQNCSNFKALEDEKVKVAKNSNFVLGRVENIAANGENVGYQHFLLFPQCFLQPFSLLKLGIVWLGPKGLTKRM